MGLPRLGADPQGTCDPARKYALGQKLQLVALGKLNMPPSPPFELTSESPQRRQLEAGWCPVSFGGSLQSPCLMKLLSSCC